MWFEFDNLIYLPIAGTTVSTGKIVLLATIAGILAVLSGNIGFSVILLLAMNLMEIPMQTCINSVNLCIVSLFAERLVNYKKYHTVDWKLIVKSIPWMAAGLTLGIGLYMAANNLYYFQAITKSMNILILGYIAIFFISHGFKGEVERYSVMRYSKPKRRFTVSVKSGKRIHILSLAAIGFVPGFLTAVLGSGSPIIVKGLLYEIYSNRFSDTRGTFSIMLVLISASIFVISIMLGAHGDVVLSMIVVTVFMVATTTFKVLIGNIFNASVRYTIAGLIAMLFLLFFMSSLVAKPVNMYYVTMS